LYGLTGNVAGLNGLNVSQVLPIEELALGGASTGYSVIDLDALGADLDLAFSLGVDTPFAQDHLELPTTTPPTPTPEPSSLLLLASGLLALGMIGYWQRRGMLFFVVLLLALASSQVARADTWSPGDFTTYNELEWGDVPAPGNAASILQNNYNVVYTPELDLFTVGLPSPGFSMQFTSYDTLLVYLPALGTPGALNSNVVDPDSTSSGEFGAGVATLRLNIDFSDAGLLPNHFGDLYLTGFDPSLSQLNSLTLRQFEGDLNIALSGESTIYGITDLDSIAADINESFDPAVGDLTFADDHLTATNPNGNGNPVTTPEPSSLLLLTSGLLALWTFRCWRRGSAIPN
jgi:hypothetical protein